MKNKNIQIARSISILLVMITHSPLILPCMATHYGQKFQHIFNTSIGVDLFFIISGYLMGKTFIAKISLQKMSLKDAFLFYGRRIDRLFLTTVFWSCFIILFASVWIKMHLFPNISGVIGVTLSGLTYTGNFYNAIHENVFGYFWSLGVEMQFYLLLPVIVYVGKKRTWGIAAILLLFHSVLHSQLNLFWFRPNALYIGLLVWFLTENEAFAQIRGKINTHSHWILIPFICTFLLAAVYLAQSFYSSYVSLGYTVVGIILAISFIVIAFYDKPILGVFSKPFYFVGDISFSLYMCHIPVWLLTKYILDKYSNLTPYPVFAISMIFSFLAAYFSYYFIENKKGHRTKHKAETICSVLPD